MKTRSDDSDQVKIFEVLNVWSHESYSYDKKKFIIGDIGLIKLNAAVPINEYILPICLPTKQLNSEKAVVAGFGATENGPNSESLMKVTLERFNHDECQNFWGKFSISKFSQVCYGHHTEPKDSCRVRLI